MAAYPASVQTFTDHVDTTENIDADHVNKIQHEVVALESTVGTNPHISTGSGGSTFGAWLSTSRTYASLSDRLANIEAGVVADAHTQYAKKAGDTFSGGVSVPTLGVTGSATVVDNLQVGGIFFLNEGMGSFRMRPTQVAEFTDQTFTSTSWTAGSPSCQTTFPAPPSGQVMVFVLCHMTNPTSAVYCDFQVFHGVVDTPHNVRSADPSTAAFNQSGGQISAIGFDIVTGLAPGDNYIVRTVHQVLAGTGTILQRRLLVVPMS